MKKVLIGLSGGIDSSVGMMLLKRDGWALEGATYVTSEDRSAAEGARRLCDNEQVHHTVIDLREEFKTSVIQYFIDEYMKGRTPNPCVICNPTIKWGRLMEAADKMGCWGIATGHYARIGEKNGRFFVRGGKDIKKDQSYFLYRLSQEQLKRTLFPLGELTKDEVRAFAAQNGYNEIARMGESQDICFLPDNDYRAFLRQHGCEAQKGHFIDVSGNVIGEHEGYPNYTIGQRKGLKVAFGEPRYVVKIDAERNEVTLGLKENLIAKRCLVGDVVWQKWADFEDGAEVMAKYRYKTKAVSARLYHKGDSVEVVFNDSADAITPGQSVVWYDGEDVVGGGIIICSIDNLPLA